MKKLMLCISLIIMSMGLISCTQNLSPNTYNANDVGVTSSVKRGVIIARRTINIDNNSGVGGVAGTVVGAAAGSQIGGSPAANVVGAVGGAVFGGLMGNAIDKSVNRQKGFEYIIKLNNGRTVSVVQALNVQLQVNQPVLIMFGPKTRVIPDESSY